MRNTTRRASSKCITAGFLHFIAALLVAHAASSAPLPRLVVVRAEQAADCPDAVALARIVEQQMQRPALDPISSDPAAFTYNVEIAHAAEGYSATIRAGDLTRELSDPAPTCAELADALALMLAILLDSDSTAPAPEPPAAMEVTPAKPFSPPREPAQTSTIVRHHKPLRTWGISVAAGLGQTAGFLAPWSWAIDTRVFIHRNRLSMSAGLFAIPFATFEDIDDSSVDAHLITGSLSVCGRLIGQSTSIHLSLCSESLVGGINVTGHGYVENRQETKPWASLGSAALLDGPFTRSLGWFIRFAIAVPIVRQRLIATRVDGNFPNAIQTTATIFEPPPIAGFLGIGVRWTIL